MTAGFKKQLPIPSLPSDPKNVFEQGPSDALATESLGRTHRLQLTFPWRQFFQRDATQQYIVAPSGPESYVRCSDLLRVEREYVFRGSDFVHVPQMLLEERQHLRPGYVVDLDVHTLARARAR